MQDQGNFKHITFIGAGNMSRSIIGGLINHHYPADKITATNPSLTKLHQLQHDFDINIEQNNMTAVRQADVVILAVKPQIMSTVCEQLSELTTEIQDKLFISLAAAIPCARIVQLLGQPVALIRCMPNTPSMYGQGMSGLYKHQATPTQSALATEILSATGEIIWVEQESQIDAVAAISGSGPAYFFLFMEAMITKAKNLGFDDHTAKLLVKQTAIGAASMVQHSSIDIATLRQNVTSKGGTTAAALAVFEEQHLTMIVENALQAATDKAKQLAQST